MTKLVCLRKLDNYEVFISIGRHENREVSVCRRRTCARAVRAVRSVAGRSGRDGGAAPAPAAPASVRPPESAPALVRPSFLSSESCLPSSSEVEVEVGPSSGVWKRGRRVRRDLILLRFLPKLGSLIVLRITHTLPRSYLPRTSNSLLAYSLLSDAKFKPTTACLPYLPAHRNGSCLRLGGLSRLRDPIRGVLGAGVPGLGHLEPLDDVQCELRRGCQSPAAKLPQKGGVPRRWRGDQGNSTLPNGTSKSERE